MWGDWGSLWWGSEKCALIGVTFALIGVTEGHILIKPCVRVCELVREWHVQNLDPSQLSSNTHITLIWCSTHSVGVRSGGKSLGVTGGTSPWGQEWLWVITTINAILTLRPKVTHMGTRVRVYEWYTDPIWVICYTVYLRVVYKELLKLKPIRSQGIYN